MNENNYCVKQEMMYMEGFYDRNGKKCTLVKETDRLFVVNKSPLEILDFSLIEIGFNLKGAMETSKSAHKDKYMCPIMVNPTLSIVVFPTLSHKRVDAVWLNPSQIFRTQQIKGRAIIVFNNGDIIKIDSKLSFFNSKLATAEQYCKAKTNAAKNPVSFVVNPKNKKILHLLITVNCLSELLELVGPLFS